MPLIRAREENGLRRKISGSYEIGERRTLVSKELLVLNCSLGVFFTFNFSERGGQNEGKHAGNREFRGIFYSETLRTSVFLK